MTNTNEPMEPKTFPDRPALLDALRRAVAEAPEHSPKAAVLADALAHVEADPERVAVVVGPRLWAAFRREGVRS